MSTFESLGAALILRERQRQIDGEGWSREHDDEHSGGELVDAAMSYASLSTFDDGGEWAIRNWPWEEDAFNPSDDPIPNLVKAGALIAAEIDRLQRSHKSTVQP